jgi:hypothetical protein
VPLPRALLGCPEWKYRQALEALGIAPDADPTGDLLIRAKDLAELDLLYSRVEWMTLRCPAPDSEFVSICGTPGGPEPTARERWGVDVRMPPGYLAKVLRRYGGSNTDDLLVWERGHGTVRPVPDNLLISVPRSSTQKEVVAYAKAALKRANKATTHRTFRKMDRLEQLALFIYLRYRKAKPKTPADIGRLWGTMTSAWFEYYLNKDTGPVPLLREWPCAYYAHNEWRQRNPTIHEDGPGYEPLESTDVAKLVRVRALPFLLKHEPPAE